MRSYTLEPIHDSRKSFYGKATVADDSKQAILTSYNTTVARIDKTNDKAEIYGTYSQTTLRHIKEFLWQYDFPIGTKSFLEKTYMK